MLIKCKNKDAAEESVSCDVVLLPFAVDIIGVSGKVGVITCVPRVSSAQVVKGF